MESRIELSGFGDIDSSSMEIVQKNVLNHFRKIESITKNMQKLHVTMKKVHSKEKSEKYEVHVKLVDDGGVYISKVTERNLLSVVEKALEKIMNEISR